MKIDALHGVDGRFSPAGRAAFHPEARAERWLAQRHGYSDAAFREPLGQPDRGGGLALAGGRRRHRGDQHETPGWTGIIERGEVDLRDLASPGEDMLGPESE